MPERQIPALAAKVLKERHYESTQVALVTSAAEDVDMLDSDDDGDDDFVVLMLFDADEAVREASLRFDFAEESKGKARITHLDQIMHREYWCKKHFRFLPKDIARLMGLIEWPEDGYLRWGKPGNRKRFNCLECLLMTLGRLGTPGDLFDWCSMFGRTMPEISEATNACARYLWTHYRYTVQDLSQWAFLFQESADAFRAKGFPFEHCHSHLDGKLYSRTKHGDPELEHWTWNDHKKRNAENFQAFTCAHGLHIGFFGPSAEGARRNDSIHYYALGLHQQLQNARAAANALHGTQHAWIAFSDLGYPHSNLLQMKFRNPPGWMRRDFNYHCDSSRVCAEWNFSCHCQQFPSVDTYRKMNMANMATGVLTTASVIIHNWHVCTYGGLINDYFGVKPPTLERYFQL